MTHAKTTREPATEPMLGEAGPGDPVTGRFEQVHRA
jgi:hypothetical protein